MFNRGGFFSSGEPKHPSPAPSSASSSAGRPQYSPAQQHPHGDPRGYSDIPARQAHHDPRMMGGGAHGFSGRNPQAGAGGMPSQRPPRIPASSQSWALRPTKSPDNSYTYGNLVAVSPADIAPARDGSEVFIIVNDTFVFSARPLNGFPQGMISMSDPQRTWAQVALTDVVDVKLYDVFAGGNGQAYVAAMDVEVGFAGKKRVDAPYDQDELAAAVVRNFQNQILAPGQKILMDHRSVPLLLTVKTVQLGTLAMSEKPAAASNAAPTSTDPTARGILTQHSLITFYKDARSGINLKASTRRPAANAIIQPDFKFENMGIGGLDDEFSTIFRRAFASRIFPPGLVEKLGIPHVKGVLLYGPPGTGKTLIARQIGKMLNTRPPKVINGPEVLNKFVGQSEENVRKLFADAEKEYKEKGEESGLHIIIFDELDAVCKQRGSGAGGGTGVGDSVVNQLLSKLDGVDQLNNILLIGMTNRKDMIDEALLRPGRLEVHVEISLPDEHGRVQILKIHTHKMRSNHNLDPDVDLDELALRTKNFSGAELSGLVKAAASFAFNRHIKVGTVAGVSDDAMDIKVNREDFLNALAEIQPAFGASTDTLESCLPGGIIHFSPHVDSVLKQGRLHVKKAANDASFGNLFSLLLHGERGTGKTALSARIALDSDFAFVKMITPNDMLGFNDMSKIAHIHKIMSDAYKSVRSIILLDNIESIIDWSDIGPRFSVAVVQAIRVLLSKQPPKGHQLLVIATSAERSVLERLKLYRDFDAKVHVPTVRSYDELALVLRETRAFGDDHAAVQRVLDSIREVTAAQAIGVGIKEVLGAISTARQDEDMAEGFVTAMAQCMEESASLAETELGAV